MLPSGVLTDALHALRAAYHTVGLRLYVEALGAVAERVLSGQCAIGISGPLSHIPDSIASKPTGRVKPIGREACRESALSVREDIGGRRNIKQKKHTAKQDKKTSVR